MKKERLIEWGVNSETADIVLKEFNELLEVKKQLETDLSERNKQLDEFRKLKNNSDELKSHIADLQAQNEAAKNQFEKDIKNLKLIMP